jgi:DNA invertase Pin-like site-specific DNA recombinase
MKKQRVALLLRGSDRKQTSAGKLKKQQDSKKKAAREIKIEDDLPTQKQILLDFIAAQPEKNKGIEWEFSGLEFVEAGVSAYKTHTSRRKGINDAKAAAQQGLYDILLIFKLDRFGRRSGESATAAQNFIRYARLWVVDKNAEFKHATTADELMNFVEFWAAKKASEDTKVRVTAAMLQMHKNEGIWTGGNPPYGYENDPETTNKLKVIPEESEIVKEIYNLYVNHGYGFLKIAGVLNDKGKHSKKGGNWSSHTIRKILMNTVYKGHLSYGKTKIIEGEFGSYQKSLKNGEGSVSERYWPEYDIVGAEIWQAAQDIREKRVKPNAWGGKTPSRSRTGKGLLVGVLKCECGGHMTYGTSSDWKDSKRTEKKEPYGIYRCQTRLKQGVKACGAQRATHRTKNLESQIMQQLNIMLLNLVNEKEIQKIKANALASTKDIKNEITQIKKDIEKNKNAMDNAKAKVKAILMGELDGSNESLYNEIYSTAETKYKELQKELSEMEQLKNTDDLNEKDLINLENLILNWQAIFEKGTQQQKRNLIQALVDEIKVTKEKVAINVAIDIVSLVETMTAIKETAASLENKGFADGAEYLQNSDSRCTDGKQKTGMIDLQFMNSWHSNGNTKTSMLKKLAKLFTEKITDKITINQAI